MSHHVLLPLLLAVHLILGGIFYALHAEEVEHVHGCRVAGKGVEREEGGEEILVGLLLLLLLLLRVGG